MTRIWIGLAALWLAALGAGGAAMAEALWRPAVPDGHVVIFIDQARLEKAGAIATVWALAILANPMPSPMGPISAIESRERFDCGQRLHQTLSIQYQSVAGKPIGHAVPTKAADAVQPNDILDFLMKAACDGEYASGDTFADAAAATNFGRAWARSYGDPTAPVMARAVATMHSEPPPPSLTDLALPDGRLAGLTAIPQQMAFLDLDHIERHGDQIGLVMYFVYPPGGLVAGAADDAGATQHVDRVRLDCAAKTFQDMGGLEFNDDDVLVLWMPKQIAPQPLAANTTLTLTARLLCPGGFAPPANTVVGHAAAFAFGRRTLADKPLLDSLPKVYPAAAH